MTLLAPTAALIAAGLTLPVLLVFYLLKLRRRPVRVSTTYLWAQTLQELQVNIPLRWLRASWLLLLHLAILALLVLAVGRPAMPVPGLAAQRLIILIDRSASMSAVDVEAGTASGGGAKRSRLDQAKIEARRLIDNLFAAGDGRTAAVVAFAAEARDLTGFTSDRGRLKIAIDELTPTDQPGDLASALRLVDALASGAASDDDSTNQTPTLVILSDGSFAGGLPPIAIAANVRYLPIGPHEEPPPSTAPNASPAPGAAPEPPPGHDNVGIVSFSARRDYDNPAIARVFARIQNASPWPRAAALTLSVDSEVVARRPLSIPGAALPAGAAADPGTRPVPGQATTTFELQTAEASLVVLALSDPDALAADDTAAMVIPAPTRPRCLLVVPDEDATSDSLLEDNLVEMRLTSVRRVTASEYGELAGQSDFSSLDLIVFDRVAPRRLPATATISFGASLPIAGLTLTPAPPDADTATYFLTWQRAHPIMRAVAPDTVVVARPMILDYTPPATGDPALTKAVPTELARGSTGPLILLLETGLRRHLVVGFDLGESTWPLQAGFTVFLASAIDYLTVRGEEAAGRFVTTAGPASARLGPAPLPPRLTLSGPLEISAAVPPGAAPGDEVPLGLIERAGVYRIRELPPGPAGLVCVNLLDETESGLDVRTRLTVAGRPVRAYAAETAPREIWPWFVAAAGLLLAIEWFLYAWKMRA